MPANTTALATSKPGPDIAMVGTGPWSCKGQGHGQGLPGLWLLALVMGFCRGGYCCLWRIVLDALSYVEHSYPRLGDALPRRHIVSFF